MTTMMSDQKCKQCGYELGDFELNCHTSEWNFDCRRCGHGESSDWITAADGTRIGWKHATLDGHGAVWAMRPNKGISLFHGLRCAKEVEEAAQNMRQSIAKGELDGESSYVTRWDAEAKRADVVAGTWVEQK